MNFSFLMFKYRIIFLFHLLYGIENIRKILQQQKKSTRSHSHDHGKDELGSPQLGQGAHGRLHISIVRARHLPSNNGKL